MYDCRNICVLTLSSLPLGISFTCQSVIIAVNDVYTGGLFTAMLFTPGCLQSCCLHLVVYSHVVYTWLFTPGCLQACCLYIVLCSHVVCIWFFEVMLFTPGCLQPCCLYIVLCSHVVYTWLYIVMLLTPVFFFTDMVFIYGHL